ncbi:MAG: hypothetical protein Q6370_023005 [Candidatus Sigynarchaeota archaeon]
MHGDAAGNVYICGDTDSFGIGETDLLLLKYAANGTLLWNRTWGSRAHLSFREGGTDVVCDPAGNVYTCGYMVPSSGAQPDLLLVKWSPGGQQLWNRSYGGIYTERAWCMTLATTGDIYCYAEYYKTSIQILFTRWSPGGALLLARNEADYYPGGPVESLVSAPPVASTASLYSIANYCHDKNPAVTKWYTNGTRQWRRTSGFPPDEDSFRDILLMTNGDILLSGRSSVHGGYLMRWNNRGEPSWNVTWGDYDISVIGRMYRADKDCIFTILNFKNFDHCLAKINVTAIEAQFLDTDNDTISDYDEVYTYFTSPGRPDTDGDGLFDWNEIFYYRTDPRLADTDGDGVTDPEEISSGTDPRDPDDNPASRRATMMAIAIGFAAIVAAGVANMVLVHKYYPAAKQKLAAARQARRTNRANRAG